MKERKKLLPTRICCITGSYRQSFTLSKMISKIQIKKKKKTRIPLEKKTLEVKSLQIKNKSSLISVKKRTKKSQHKLLSQNKA
jgi:hypothetical protein